MVVITLSVILKVYLDTVSGSKLLSHCLEHCIQAHSVVV